MGKHGFEQQAITFNAFIPSSLLAYAYKQAAVKVEFAIEYKKEGITRGTRFFA
jgi:hypothetical protein